MTAEPVGDETCSICSEPFGPARPCSIDAIITGLVVARYGPPVPTGHGWWSR